ncbi:MAG: hypothetical protein Q7J31_15635, partial [Syntrophales bacterium]|uniref:hypothetical protein n=1 Tax=Candidatus Wunengus sp. YC61 TaxID=3367698 RepID=UPI0027236B03|nr:hypothetical protein [Syntrophales bacterium]
ETLTCSPAQTCANANEQVEQVQHIENSKDVSNLLTCSPETEGVNKHKHLTAEEINYVGI